jgi:hypothetical protein
VRPAPLAPAQDRKAEYEAKRAEAEGSVEKLWKLYDWCEAYSLESQGRSVLRAILKLDQNDRKAHELLGELEYDGKWFPNQKKLDEYKKKKLDEEAKKTGKVVFQGELVDPGDLPYLEKGMKRLEDGRWVSAQEHQRITEGCIRQDLEWVPPSEAANLEKGLWKCGDKWLTEAEANAYHAELGRWWKVPSDHFVVYSTCDRAVVAKIVDECERAYREFNRVLGKSPADKVAVLVLRSADQYNAFGSGDMGATELRPYSSLHGATIAEIWPDPLREGMTSAGVAYWEAGNPKVEPFGPYFVRHAAAQSLAEALDPSPKKLAVFASGRPAGDPEKEGAEWWGEKRFPQWFRYGACAYVERYIVDSLVAADGDPDHMKKWSVNNILNKGGLDPVDQILACELSLADVPKSQKLVNEAGLLVSFTLDGKCPPVTQAHQALKDAFKNGKDLKPAFKALEEALTKSSDELQRYAEKL